MTPPVQAWNKLLFNRPQATCLQQKEGLNIVPQLQGVIVDTLLASYLLDPDAVAEGKGAFEVALALSVSNWPGDVPSTSLSYDVTTDSAVDAELIWVVGSTFMKRMTSSTPKAWSLLQVCEPY